MPEQIQSASVIEKKKPSERVKRTTYPEKKSFRDDIKDAIDRILKEGSAKEFDELLYKLEDAGYEIKRGKHISLKKKDQKRFIRLRSLGDGYTEDDLKKILAGEMEHAFYDNEKAEKQPKTYQRKKEDHEFDLLIDIQKKLAQGKGKYYVRFAKNFNTKQVAKAVLYLKQHDIRSYDDLEKNVKTATVRFTELSASIEANEKRLAEIQVLKKHIFDYFKTKDVYADYRKCGYSKKFLEEHRQEILLHKAAKNAFDELHLKKLPKAICNVCAFYCMSYYYAFKSEFPAVDAKKVFMYDKFYSDKDFQLSLINRFRDEFLTGTILVIKELTVTYPNLNTWVRDKKSTKVFNDKVDEKIQIDMSLEENYKKFVDTYKS